MPMIVGLGNPGQTYAGTRHNIGFDILDSVADTLSVELEKGGGPFLSATGRYKGRKATLVAPTTYMNRSGEAVLRASRLFRVAPEDILICYDDINLPTGKVRLRPEGSDGGHNGMKDIIEKLGTRSIPRLRFGIYREFPKGKQSEFVLSPFDSDQKETVSEALQHARDASLCFISDGITNAMNRYN